MGTSINREKAFYINFNLRKSKILEIHVSGVFEIDVDKSHIALYNNKVAEKADGIMRV